MRAAAWVGAAGGETRHGALAAPLCCQAGRTRDYQRAVPVWDCQGSHGLGVTDTSRGIAVGGWKLVIGLTNTVTVAKICQGITVAALAVDLTRLGVTGKIHAAVVVGSDYTFEAR